MPKEKYGELRREEKFSAFYQLQGGLGSSCIISLTSQLFIEVTVPSKENAVLFICVVRISNLPLSTILIFIFGIVGTVWYFSVFILVLVIVCVCSMSQ
jgi:hypothetical protein